MGLEMLYAAVVGLGGHELVEGRICILFALETVEAVCALVGDVLAVWSMIE